MAADVARWAWSGRRWAVVALLAVVVLAVVVAGAGHAAAPWIIYGGL